MYMNIYIHNYTSQLYMSIHVLIFIMGEQHTRSKISLVCLKEQLLLLFFMRQQHYVCVVIQNSSDGSSGRTKINTDKSYLFPTVFRFKRPFNQLINNLVTSCPKVNCVMIFTS